MARMNEWEVYLTLFDPVILNPDAFQSGIEAVVCRSLNECHVLTLPLPLLARQVLVGRLIMVTFRL